MLKGSVEFIQRIFSYPGLLWRRCGLSNTSPPLRAGLSTCSPVCIHTAGHLCETDQLFTKMSSREILACHDRGLDLQSKSQAPWLDTSAYNSSAPWYPTHTHRDHYCVCVLTILLFHSGSHIPQSCCLCSFKMASSMKTVPPSPFSVSSLWISQMTWADMISNVHI